MIGRTRFDELYHACKKVFKDKCWYVNEPIKERYANWTYELDFADRAFVIWWPDYGIYVIESGGPDWKGITVREIEHNGPCRCIFTGIHAERYIEKWLEN